MSGDLSGFSLFELFKLEAEAHAAVLSDGLLAIEAKPDELSHIEGLMRAAHSIKGAARIIGLDPIVDLAHAMEDCFVSVQRGTETLTSARVDQLFRGVDLIQGLAQLNEQEAIPWVAEQTEVCQQLTEQLRQPPPSGLSEPAETSSADQATEIPDVPAPQIIKEPASVELPSETAEAVTRKNEAPAEPQTRQEPTRQESRSPDIDTGASDIKEPDATTTGKPADPSASAAAVEPAADTRTIPVSSASLHQIMRLASESMIDARRLQKTQQGLAMLRDSQRRFTTLLSQLGQADRLPDGQASMIEELRSLNRTIEDRLQDHAAQLDKAFWNVDSTSTALYHQVIGSRMRPFREGTQPFPRMIRDLSRTLGKQVRFQILGETVAVDRDILRKLEAPLNHILRNSLDHGIETPAEREAAGKPPAGSVTLEARHHAGMLTVRGP